MVASTLASLAQPVKRTAAVSPAVKPIAIHLNPFLILYTPDVYKRQRGRTLDNAYIILDEAQNTTPAQMKICLLYTSRCV